MIIKVEHFIEFSENVLSSVYDETLSEFNLILNNLYNAKKLSFMNETYDQRSQCVTAMKGTFKNFKVGFGTNHMWVHQTINGEMIPSRLLIVEF